MTASSAEGAAPLTWRQRRFLLVLALPAFGIALAYTIVSTYVPVLVDTLSGPAVTGVLIGGEGVLGLLIPVLVGSWSDGLRTRIGGRLPFVIAGAVLAVAGLVLLPVFAATLVGLALALGLFLVGYFVYFAPYYAMYPDLVRDEIRGRSFGFQGALRSGGLLLGLAGGGVLLSLWQPLPFIVGAVAIVAVTAGLALGMWRRLGQGEGAAQTRNNAFATAWAFVRYDRSLRNWAIANALWEAAIAALRTFVVLYFVRGLGLSLQLASAALALVGLAAVVAAPVSGKLADRFGARPVMLVALWTFAIGVLPGVLTTNTWFIAAIVPIAFAAVALLTLPFTVLIGLLPEGGDHAAGASLFSASRGIGVMAGPLLAGFAIEVLAGVPVLALDDTRGYAAVFLVTSGLLFTSIPVLRRIAIARR